MSETLFRFKKFQVSQEKCAMKINTDGVLLGAWVNCKQAEKILDIGTGSGVIAMMLAQRSTASRIVGVEIDEASCEEAEMNMKLSPWPLRLSVFKESIQDFTTNANEEFDLVVSNPPFFSGGTLSSTQQRSLVKHTVKLPHSDLLRSAYELMSKEGQFFVVLPYIEGLRFIELAEQYRLYCNHICEVSSFENSPVERLLLSFNKFESEQNKEAIFIRKDSTSFSDSYINLTRDFYLKM